ncbi:hypothetical protein QE152_g8623 [Popillia japonica]|uniref:Uncharacterized protein n=1 Tax=Popillia japonica TaxID=7064 RepID=A0AAW1M341_POPJA
MMNWEKEQERLQRLMDEPTDSEYEPDIEDDNDSFTEDNVETIQENTDIYTDAVFVSAFDDVLVTVGLMTRLASTKIGSWLRTLWRSLQYICLIILLVHRLVFSNKRFSAKTFGRRIGIGGCAFNYADPVGSGFIRASDYNKARFKRRA